MPPKKANTSELNAQISHLQQKIQQLQAEIVQLQSTFTDFENAKKGIQQKNEFLTHSLQYASDFRTKLLKIAEDFIRAVQTQESNFNRYAPAFFEAFKEKPHQAGCPLLHPILKKAYQDFSKGSRALYEKVIHPENTLHDDKRSAFEDDLRSIHKALTEFIKTKPQNNSLNNDDALLYKRAEELLEHVNAALLGLTHLQQLPEKIERITKWRDFEVSELSRLEREYQQKTQNHTQELSRLQAALEDLLKESAETAFMGDDNSPDNPVSMPEDPALKKKTSQSSPLHQKVSEQSQP